MKSAGFSVHFHRNGGGHPLERGVEAETLACGTGAVASAILLTAWGEASGQVELVTKSGRSLRVRLRRGEDGSWEPSLSGHAAVVFTGKLSEVLG